jgi:hypothetical protein
MSMRHGQCCLATQIEPKSNARRRRIALEDSMMIEQQQRRTEGGTGKEKAEQETSPQAGHIEPQPSPGHTENIPVGPDMPQAPRGGVIEEGAPTAEPGTKPATPPGTQSERDRARTRND